MAVLPVGENVCGLTGEFLGCVIHSDSLTIIVLSERVGGFINYVISILFPTYL
jgi:hypothetical protein